MAEKTGICAGGETTQYTWNSPQTPQKFQARLQLARRSGGCALRALPRTSPTFPSTLLRDTAPGRVTRHSRTAGKWQGSGVSKPRCHSHPGSSAPGRAAALPRSAPAPRAPGPGGAPRPRGGAAATPAQQQSCPVTARHFPESSPTLPAPANATCLPPSLPRSARTPGKSGRVGTCGPSASRPRYLGGSCYGCCSCSCSCRRGY